MQLVKGRQFNPDNIGVWNPHTNISTSIFPNDPNKKDYYAKIFHDKQRFLVELDGHLDNTNLINLELSSTISAPIGHNFLVYYLISDLFHDYHIVFQDPESDYYQEEKLLKTRWLFLIHNTKNNLVDYLRWLIKLRQ